MKHPRVFISYSHDSAEHKAWVLDFATTLRNRGADAVLDQWDLKPGDDLPHFMETELATCDFAIMVCTERYVQKANAGEGGVGYEKMIMTASLLKTIDSNKIIPVIRQVSGNELPTFLRSKVYVDFSKDDDVEYSLDELLRRLLDSPLFEKPEIGTNPFKPLNESKPDRVSDGIKLVMGAVSEGFNSSDSGRRGRAFISYESVVKNLKMHRLTTDRYMALAVDKGLVTMGPTRLVGITAKGIEYLISHGIIEE